MSRLLALPLALLSLVGLFGLTACEPAPDTYVSLGDSMMSGPLVPGQIAAAAGCLRSDRNAAHLVAPKIRATRFIDVSCSGATTANLTGSQTTPEGTVHPPQFDVLDARTKVVTIGIGGNDIGFSDIVATCLSRMAFFQNCKPAFVSGSNDVVSTRIAQLRPRLASAYAEITRRAPHAKVFVVPYLPMLPSGSGCAPMSPFDADLPWLRAKLDELKSMTRSVALAAGFTYLDSIANATGHDMCKSAGTKWVEGLIPSSVAAPFHPNADGYAGEAPLLAAAINAVVTS